MPLPILDPSRTLRGVVREPDPVVYEDEAETAAARATRFERKPANGTYTGPARVRVLPPGVGSEEIRDAMERRLVAGATWFRGDQRIRIVKAGPMWVVFRELSHGDATRRCSRAALLNGGHPERL